MRKEKLQEKKYIYIYIYIKDYQPKHQPEYNQKLVRHSGNKVNNIEKIK
jgi:hypothetical protein